MQAVRQCSVCASRAAGGLLRNQNNGVVRSEATSLRFISGSESKKPGVQKVLELSGPTQRSITSLSVARGLCDVPLTQVENLSYNSMIRRAASLVTDSSATFLSQTTLAFTDALTYYSKAVLSRIAVQRQYLASVGKMSAAEEESLQQTIGGWRALASERLEECKHYEMTWISAVNMCELAAEAAYTSGAQQASVSMKTNIQTAQLQVEEARKLSAEADKKLAETKVEEIQRMAEYTAFLEDSDEHEVHEAYLRED